ncbi:MAG TPA: type IV secretion system DNA-binding domain-containing protein [Caulobacterales bacterium]|nr:type IV secretion system DNA-binding domain-containing protein [Caulobacterales bacterium]
MGLGKTNARASFRPFGVRQTDRFSHLYVVGETGVGKTTLLQNLILQDIDAGTGCAFVDPHGDAAKRILEGIPGQGAVRYVDIGDPTLKFGYNPLTRVSFGHRPLAASGLISVMKKMWSDAWGVRMEHILRNTLLALLDQPHAELPDVLRMLGDRRFRAVAVRNIENEQVREFWAKEFPAYSPRHVADSIAPIQNKVGAFLADPRLRRFVCPEDRGLRLRQIMDEGKVLLVNLSKGILGEDSASILGGMLVTAIGLAALSRADIPEHERRPFFLYLDEFQNVTTLAMAEMLSELRKYGVGLVMAHQYLAQLEPEIRHAVLGNAGTIISFRVGPEDAHVLARQFAPAFQPLDLMNLPNRHFYIRLMIDGAPSKPFSAVTMTPEEALAAQAARRRAA